ncbi:portal vertex protein [uncultured Caudovirales phage]|uniref:Portal protein n=1 Tax=uncultured Caudovirales phage TaxID=2100421 RepID=A0A6J5KZJ5_9CAUD|nr:portal vertex protein [uncultured Caudovirales phage]
MNFFGIEIKKKQGKQEKAQSVVPPAADDGSTVLSSINAGAYYGMVLDVEGIIKNENDLIRRYREIAGYADCDSAVEDIVNEALIADDDKQPVEIVLDDLKVSEAIKTKIREEFTNVLRLLRVEERGHDIFKTWYVDGRLYYHVMIDENRVSDGILEMRPIDPRKIRKIKNITKEKTDKGVEIVKKVEEYYLFNDKGITEQTTAGIKMSLDSVVFCPSGIVDTNTGMMLSHLHKAIKPVNQLKLVEDSLVIYRISRAPERRVFYIDVGNLPKVKAEQYVNDMMARFRNKIVYDATTGEVRDDKKHMSMLEDFWMPRREGGKGTEITTLPGGQTLGQIDDINYFQNKLYQALNVPITRMKPDSGFNLGRGSEITRDEVKFSKFIQRLRKRFSYLFADTLRVQLIAKKIINEDEWADMKQVIRFDFIKDNFFSELKDSEVLQGRLNMLALIDPYIGKYYSMAWVRKNVLQQNEDTIKEIDKEIKVEKPLLDKMRAEQQGEPQ